MFQVSSIYRNFTTTNSSSICRRTFGTTMIIMNDYGYHPWNIGRMIQTLLIQSKKKQQSLRMTTMMMTTICQQKQQ